MKTKRYDDGGYTGDDPIVKYRMGIIDDKGAPISKVKEETSADLDPYGAAGKEPTAVEKTVVKTRVSEAGSKPKTTQVSETKASPKVDTVKEAKETIGLSSFPKSFKEAGGNTTPKKSTVDMPSMKIKVPDPLSNFNSKGQRTGGKDFELGIKKGGAIKKMAGGGSASRRGDGCAVKGKTRGKMC
jgi:hypothetical protein